MMQKNISTSIKLIDFYTQLEIENNLPENCQLLNPFKSREVQKLFPMFCEKYFNDSNPRTLLLGINPGRFGAGVTGIPFTDPVRLEESLGIPNTFEKKTELSSVFIYKMIERFGGAQAFYSKYILSAVCPLGFVKDGLNLNYYDIPQLQWAIKPFIVETLKRQIEIAQNNQLCYAIGKGKNLQFLQKLNTEFRLFKEIKVLEHPRWVMQYRFKEVDKYIEGYCRELKGV